MKIFMACLGTLGDFHPYLSLGVELASRKHEVTILSDATKRETTIRAGLNFEEVVSQRSWESFVSHPALWHPGTCVPVVFKSLLAPATVPVYNFVKKNHERGNTLLMGGAGAMGFRLAREKLDLPLVHLHLSPYQAKPLEPASGDGERLARDFLNAVRRDLSLPDLTVPFADWYHCADLAVAAYPQWFHQEVRTAPSTHLAFTSFVYGDAAYTEDASDWKRFVSAGSPPVVFTVGTGMRHGEEFFRAALSASERLSLRAIFLTAHPSQLPSVLPPTVHSSRYIRLEQLLPHVEGIVHHGGIGTCAQALKAGIPQLVMPLAFDQFDNAAHLERLAAGRTISSSRIGTQEFVDKLASLRSDAGLWASSKDLAARLREGDARKEIADLIEWKWLRQSVQRSARR